MSKTVEGLLGVKKFKTVGDAMRHFEKELEKTSKNIKQEVLTNGARGKQKGSTR